MNVLPTKIQEFDLCEGTKFSNPLLVSVKNRHRAVAEVAGVRNVYGLFETHCRANVFDISADGQECFINECLLKCVRYGNPDAADLWLRDLNVGVTWMDLFLPMFTWQIKDGGNG